MSLTPKYNIREMEKKSQQVLTIIQVLFLVKIVLFTITHYPIIFLTWIHSNHQIQNITGTFPITAALIFIKIQTHRQFQKRENKKTFKKIIFTEIK